MAEYIERDKAVNVIVEHPYRLAMRTVRAIEEVKSIPAADVVEVVRCKDCNRGHRKFRGKTEVIECQLYHHEDPRQYKDPMDFCSHGVRREQSDERIT